MAPFPLMEKSTGRSNVLPFHNSHPRRYGTSSRRKHAKTWLQQALYPLRTHGSAKRLGGCAAYRIRLWRRNNRVIDMLMNEQQEKHLADIKATFNQIVDSKYRKGQAEHGGDLWQLTGVQLIDCAIDEAVDQVTYLLT